MASRFRSGDGPLDAASQTVDTDIQMLTQIPTQAEEEMYLSDTQADTMMARQCSAASLVSSPCLYSQPTQWPGLHLTPSPGDQGSQPPHTARCL